MTDSTASQDRDRLLTDLYTEAETFNVSDRECERIQTMLRVAYSLAQANPAYEDQKTPISPVGFHPYDLPMPRHGPQCQCGCLEG